MKGILEKRDGKWHVKWSDLHSWSHGTLWNLSPIHPSETIDETKLKVGDEVEIELIKEGYSFDIELGYWGVPIYYFKFKKHEEMKTFYIVFSGDEGRVSKIWLNSESKSKAISSLKNIVNQDIKIIYCEKV